MCGDGLPAQPRRGHPAGVFRHDSICYYVRVIASCGFKVRDYIRDLDIRVRHIGTKFNPADFFTKALPRVDFERYRSYLGMEDHTPPT